MTTPPDIIDRYRKLRALADHPNTDPPTARAARQRASKIEAAHPTVNLEAFPEPTRPSHGAPPPVDFDAILRSVFAFGRNVKDFFADVDDVIAKASVAAQGRALIEDNMEAADVEEAVVTVGKGKSRERIKVAVFEYTIPIDVLEAIEALGEEGIQEAARAAGELFGDHIIDVLTGTDDEDAEP